MGLFSSVTNIVKDTASFFTGGTAGVALANGKDPTPFLALDAAGLAAGAGLSGVLGSLGAGIGGSISSALGTLQESQSSILGGLGDVIKSVKDTIGPILQSVGGVVHDVANTVRDINEGVIKPIVGPINEAIDTFKALRQILERDLKDGIKGILRIPEDVSNALGSLDATITRSLQMLGLQNSDALTRIMVPAMRGADGRTMGDLNLTIESVLANAPGTFTPPPRVHLEEGPNIEAFKEWVRKQQEELYAEKSLPGLIVNWLSRGVAVIEGLAVERRPFLKLWEEEAFRAAGVERYDPATALRLYGDDVISEQDCIEEIRAAGYSETRAKALVEGVRQLPNTSQALEWYRNRWIDSVTATKMLRTANWSEQDIELLLNSSYRVLAAGDLVELMRRGLLSTAEVQGELERQGYRQFDANLLVRSSSRLLGLQDLIQAYDRASVEHQGIGFDTLRQAAPPELKAQGAALGIEPGDVDVLWANHWRLLTPELACRAYFRGYINLPMLREALASYSIPAELHENFIDLQRPVLSYRQILQLVQHGIISEGDGVAELRKLGYGDVNANYIVQLELHAAKPGAAQQADTTHGLTQATVLSLYDSGTITDDEASKLLAELGWVDEAIASTLLLHQVRAASAERQSSIDLVIARAKAGLFTYEDAIGELGNLSLTSAESTKAVARLTSEVTQHTKLPSESQLLAMWKHGLLSETATLQALTLLGFSEAWASLLLQLEAERGTRSPQ